MNIIEVDHYFHNQPACLKVLNDAFDNGGAFIQSIVDALLLVHFETPAERIQLELSNQIINTFSEVYEDSFSSHNQDTICHLGATYKYDGVFSANDVRIGVEVQFRPDFLKDLSRFQMGYYSDRIKMMIYIVAIHRNSINPNYKTMPQFGRICEQLQIFIDWLDVPILVIGINGDYD